MKLVIKRTKKSGFGGKSKYELYVRADVTEEEATLIRENSLGKDNVIYHDRTGDAEGFFAVLMKMIKDTNMTVDTFVRGTTFACKDVRELVEIEDDTRSASLYLLMLLDVVRSFGGEEVIDVDNDLKLRLKKNREKENKDRA